MFNGRLVGWIQFSMSASWLLIGRYESKCAPLYVNLKKLDKKTLKLIIFSRTSQKLLFLIEQVKCSLMFDTSRIMNNDGSAHSRYNWIRLYCIDTQFSKYTTKKWFWWINLHGYRTFKHKKIKFLLKKYLVKELKSTTEILPQAIWEIHTSYSKSRKSSHHNNYYP